MENNSRECAFSWLLGFNCCSQCNLVTIVHLLYLKKENKKLFKITTLLFLQVIAISLIKAAKFTEWTTTCRVAFQFQLDLYSTKN